MSRVQDSGEGVVIVVLVIDVSGGVAGVHRPELGPTSR